MNNDQTDNKPSQNTTTNQPNDNPPVTPPKQIPPDSPTPTTSNPPPPVKSEPEEKPGTPPTENKKVDFPFKPIDDVSAPQANQNKDLNLGDEEIKSAPEPANEPPAHDDTAIPAVISKPSGGAKSVITVMAIIVAFIALGFAGGFYGYKYSPKIAKIFSATADTTTSTDTQTNTVKPPQSKAAAAGDVSVWPLYTNTFYKYSLKYPDTWYSQGTGNPTGKTLSLTGFNPAESTTTGAEVNIDTQSLNGKTLADWIAANNTVTGTTGTTLTPLTVSGQNGYQQTSTGTTQSTTTYISRGDYVLTITYTAPETQFSANQSLYNKIITSLTLT